MGRIKAPRGIHILIHRTCEYGALSGKGETAGVIKVIDGEITLGSLGGPSVTTESLKVEERGRWGQTDVTQRGLVPPSLALKMEKGRLEPKNKSEV